ncbi:hypothetical protein [Peribacillus frigoritolerans]|uniref:hypothetical protein n=1 Tax=Peribacillus frigoritolerans TaxID=450367 RepID=UPI00315CEE79
MGLSDTIKDLKALAVGIENIDLISKLMDVQIQAYEILDENRALRLKLEQFERAEETETNLSYEGDLYYKIDDNSGPFCSRCWDVDKLLVRVPIGRYNGVWKGICKNCNSWGRIPQSRIPHD